MKLELTGFTSKESESSNNLAACDDDNDDDDYDDVNVATFHGIHIDVLERITVTMLISVNSQNKVQRNV